MADPESGNTAPLTTPDKISAESVGFDPRSVGRTDEDKKQFIRDQLYKYAETVQLPEGATAEDLKAFLDQDFKFRIPKDQNLANKLNELAGGVLKEEYETLYVLKKGAPIEINDVVGGPSSLGTDISMAREQGEVAKSGDPVNLFNGNFAYQTTDFKINGAGIEFAFTRSYSQLSSYLGPLGYKWDHAYNLWIRLSEDQNVIHCSSGTLREEIYRRHELYQYWFPEQGETGILLAESGLFVLQKPDGTRVLYTPHSVLGPQIYVVNRIEDRFGNYLQFQYADGLLNLVHINRPDRTVEFSYDQRNRIASIRDFTGRMWRYDYDDLGDLVAVTTPATTRFKSGLTTQYTYSTAFISDFSSQHNLVSILDADGHLYMENTYGIDSGLLSYNRIVCQRQGGGATYFEYSDVVEDFDFTYKPAEQPTCQTIVTDRDGMQSRCLFNRSGNMVFRETYARINGIPQRVSWHYRYNRDGNLTGTISPLGIVTQFLYGRDYYERQFPQSDDYRSESDANLTPIVRQSFGHLLAAVKRGRYYTLTSLNLSQGIWSGDLFPSIFETDESDCIQKFTYEPEFSQLLTASDVRFTASADPNFSESPAYYDHLIRHDFEPASGFQYYYLKSITLPTPHLADGTLSAPVVTRFPLYDDRGRPLQIIVANGLIYSIRYFPAAAGTAEGFLQDTTADPGGLAITNGVERDALGRVTKEYSPAYYEAQDGRFARITDYNALDQSVLTVSTAPFSVRTTQDYYRSGEPRLTRIELKDERNDVTGHFDILKGYDDELHPIWETTGSRAIGNTRTTKLIFDPAGRPYLSISPSGRKQKVVYDERGRPKTYIDDYGGIHAVYKRDYDAEGRLIRETNPRKNICSHTYDTHDRPVETVDAKGNRVIRRYDKNGRTLIESFFERRPDGLFNWLYRRESAYDELGRKWMTGVNLFDISPVHSPGEITDALIAAGPGLLLKTHFYYSATGNLYQIVAPDGKIFRNEFDLLGRLFKKTDPFGNEAVLKYDREGNVVRIDRKELTRDAASGDILLEQYFAESYRYDELNRVFEKTNAMGSSRLWAYDSRNRPTRLSDQLGNVTEHHYDLFGRLSQSRKWLHDPSAETPLSVAVSYEYDKADRIVRQIDPLGRVTEFRYDGLGRQISVILPDGSADESAYDDAGNLIRYKDCNGIVKNFTYDELNRNTELRIDDSGLGVGLQIAGARYHRTDFDGLGRPTSLENDFVQWSYVHDSLGRTIHEILAVKPLPGVDVPTALSITRSFDPSGKVMNLTYPSGRQIGYERDSLDRITLITQIARGSAYPGDPNVLDNHPIARIEYEGLRRKRVNRDNGTSTEYAYDAAGRNVEIHHRQGQQTVLRLQLLFDAVNNLRQQIETGLGPQRNQLYAYDSLYRVVEARNLSAVSTLDLSTIAPAVQPVPVFIPDRQSIMNALVQTSGDPPERRYDYDAQGNRLLVRSGTSNTVYQPNELDQYEAVGTAAYQHDKNGNLIEDPSYRYFYDHRNQLAKFVKKSDLTETNIIYDVVGRKILVTEQGVAVCRAFDGFNRLEEYEDGILKSSTTYEDGQENVLSSGRENAESYYYRDLTGSVRQVFRNNQLVLSYQYDEFGNPLNAVDCADTNPFRFQGKSWIRALGQYDFNYRLYDPATGRFLQRDPLGLAAGLNQYVFAGNNPLTFVDLLGKDRSEKSKGIQPGDLTTILGGLVEKPKDWMSELHETLRDMISEAQTALIEAKAVDDEVRLLKYIRVTWLQANQMGTLARSLKGISNGLAALGWGFEFYGKFVGDESPAQTRVAKFVDASSSATLNTAFGVLHPYIAALDAAAGYLQEKILGKNYVSISKTVSGSTSTISAVSEALWTGDIAGIEKVRQKAERGEFSGAFEFFIYAGEKHAEDADVARRVETTGRFYGDNVFGRSAAFGAALPGFGYAGEKIGHAAGWTVVKSIDGGKWVGRKVEDIYDSVTDLIGYEIDW